VRISVVGLGKLGSPLAAVLASKGHTVIGVDLNPAYVAAINDGRGPIREPGLDDLIAANRAHLTATSDYTQAVHNTDLTIMVVPTPSEANGFFSMKYALAAGEAIGKALKTKNGYHVVSLASTVMPGCTGGQLLPEIENASGKNCGVDFGLCYNPEFIALGSVIRDILNPDFILIGESDPRAGQVLEDLYATVCQSSPKICRMNFVNAELTKISVNTYVTTKISYANMLAEVCEKLPGADVDVVTGAMGLDARIGRKYLKGGLGFGGPCFPRDNVAWSALARSKNCPPLIAEATDQINRHQAARLAEKVTARLPKGASAAILGLSYKAGSNVIEQSPAIALALHLIELGTSVIVHDPEAMDHTRQTLGNRVSYAASMEDAIAQGDFILLMTGWDEYKRLSPEHFKGRARRPVILDCWRMLNAEAFKDVADIMHLGYGEASTSATSPASPLAADLSGAKRIAGKAHRARTPARD
jgi:UDPglucose 6-dehydrogenase